jgi:starch-binding outer membrane protein, SusD/RagB family
MRTLSIKHLLFGALCIGTISLSACKKYLEVDPQGQLTEVNYFETSNDAVLGTNAVYNVLRNAFFNEGLYPILDIMSDDTRKGSNASDQQGVLNPFDNFTFGVTAEPPANWYNTLYLGVRRANAVIEKVPAISMDATLKNRCLGEARFLRALFYLDLVRAFGPVPKITGINPPVKVPRDTSIYRTVILPDLEFAIANLPSAYTGNDIGRATKFSAYSLRARAALFFGDFQLAATSASEVINSNLFDLEADFSNAFRPEGNYGKESVFEVGSIGIDNADAGGNEYGNTQGVRGSPNRGWGFNRPSINLMNEFEAGDPRKDKSIIFVNEVLDGVTILGDGSTPDSTKDANGTVIEYETYNQKVWANGASTLPSWGIHKKIIRYADILLMAAEALNETNQPGLAVTYLNKVRLRARHGDNSILPDFTGADKDALRNAIYHERRVELAMESHRFFDLVRTGRAVSVLGPLGFKANKNERLPIPQVEIDITQGTITQNPGW